MGVVQGGGAGVLGPRAAIRVRLRVRPGGVARGGGGAGHLATDAVRVGDPGPHRGVEHAAAGQVRVGGRGEGPSRAARAHGAVARAVPGRGHRPHCAAL